MNRPAHPLRAATLVVLVAGSPLGAQYEQPASADALIQEGVARHDQGEYDRAIEVYRQALDLEPENVVALYELAYSYSAAGRNGECVATAEAGLELESRLRPQLYTVVGNCLDAGGEPKKAARVYRRALKEFPDDALLTFNFAVTRYGQQKHEEAIELAQRAIDNAPAHASSHRLLGLLYQDRGLRVPALLATLRFLSLEPSSGRSPQAARSVVDLLGRGVTEESSSQVTIQIDTNAAKGEGELGGADMMLSLMAAYRFTDEGREMTDAELYAKTVDSLVRFFQEGPPEKRKRSWIRDVYVDFFVRAQAAEVLEPLVYRALSSLDLPGGKDWLAHNSSRVAALEEWLASP